MSMGLSFALARLSLMVLSLPVTRSKYMLHSTRGARSHFMVLSGVRDSFNQSVSVFHIDSRGEHGTVGTFGSHKFGVPVVYSDSRIVFGAFTHSGSHFRGDTICAGGSRDFYGSIVPCGSLVCFEAIQLHESFQTYDTVLHLA